MNPTMPLLIIAVFGLWLFTSLCGKLREGFIPAVLAGAEVCLLYIAGLLGNLRIGLCLIIGLGVAALGWVIFRKRAEIPGALRKSLPVAVFLTVCGLWSFFLTRRVYLTDLDDASHWYRVCKAIWADGTLPSTPEIMFRTYVPGEALWVYFTSQFIGFSFQKALLGKLILYSLCCASMLSAVPRGQSRKAGVLRVVTALCSTTVLTGQFYDLTVDILLGLVPLAAMLLLLSGKEDSFVPVLLLSSFTALIKFSGMLFSVCLALAYLLYEKGDNRLSWRRGGRKALRAGLLVFVPLCLMLLYRLRAGAVYGNELGYQALSVSRYALLFSQKCGSQIFDIILLYLHRILDVRDASDVVRLCWTAAAALAAFGCAHGRGRSAECRLIALTAVVFLILYNIGLCSVYIFSMDERESGILACFDRYYQTASVFLCGLALAGGLNALHPEEEPRRYAWMLIPLLFVNMFFIDGKVFFGKRFAALLEQTFERAEATVEEKFDYTGRSYLVFYCQSQDDGMVALNMSCYLRSDKVEACTVEEYLRNPACVDAARAEYVAFLGQASLYCEEIRESLELEPLEEYGIWRIKK